MREYEVWIEGYSSSDEYSKAFHFGTIKAKNFVEAVRELNRKNFTPAYKGDPATADDYFSVDKNGVPCIWGCRCFDNEDDARKLCG